jgi:hypothetical protein
MSNVDLYLLGSGIRGTLQFSRETIQALSSCRIAYVLHDDLMVHAYVRSLGAQVIDLAEQYTGRTERAEVYHEISRILVEEAARGPGVAFLVHGHPLFLVSATEYTLELARERALRVEMLPGVSSFDTLLCDLQVDYGYALQMYDTTTLLEHGWAPNPRVPMLLFQLSTTLNARVVEGDPDPEVLRPIVDLLAKTYGPDHRCVLVHSGAHLLETTERRDVAIAELIEHAGGELWRRPTLYVPPIE